LLYFIGRNRNLFGSNFELKARFENIQGLKAGNNVRFAGIAVGTVKKINIINDTTIEVIMIISKNMKTVIRKNAIVSIATDGFVGNKVVNIVAGKNEAEVVADGDVLASKKAIDTEDILRTFSSTNNDLAIVVANLKTTINRINHSEALWSLLSEEGLPNNLRQAAFNIRQMTAKGTTIVGELHTLVADIQAGKGSVGSLLKDTTFVYHLNEAVLKIQQVGVDADSLSWQLIQTIKNLDNEINSGKGTIHALLKDSSITAKLNQSLDNIQKGTDGFNQNMEALKHNFLFRSYFKKLERQKAKEFKK
jgi:phospholipid/cholesterol/gamma-HCH transport system substrate-binding protein